MQYTQGKMVDIKEAAAAKPAVGLVMDAVMTTQNMREMAKQGQITAADGIDEIQLQPSSLDLRLGDMAYRVQCSFLAGKGETVAQKLEKFAMYGVDISDSAILEKGAVYVVPLQEGLNLAANMYAKASPKSSIGRLDIFTRLLTENGQTFDQVPAGYKGKLYLEIAPLTFTIVVHKGDRLNQLRFLEQGGKTIAAEDLTATNAPIDDLWFSVDLTGDRTDGIIGYRARKHAPIVDLAKVGEYAMADYWEPIHATKDKTLILTPEDFYILVSKESVAIPPNWSAEMVPYDVNVGEIRIHYAGFFDPGFGYSEDGKLKTRAVLEVRAHDVPALVEEGQFIGSLIFEPLKELPEKIYGADIGSNYGSQKLKLSKYFKD